jgi:hypothetical protein
MKRLIFLIPLVLGCPDYSLKGTATTAAAGEDTADGEDNGEDTEEDTALPSDDSALPEDSGDSTVQTPDDLPPEEECDGEDNDGDGLIDEDFPDTDGDGIADCMEIIHTVDITLTVDDVWQGWADGAVFAGETPGWNVMDEFSLSMDSGPHVIAIHGWDTGAAISGHLSSIAVDGAAHFMTGDGSWRVSTDAVPGAWQEVGFDDSAWMVPVACADTSPWASWTPDILADGAVWTWYAPDGGCRDPSAYGSAYYRLSFVLP